jgi:transcriptional antiterminator NusG
VTAEAENTNAAGDESSSEQQLPLQPSVEAADGEASVAAPESAAALETPSVEAGESSSSAAPTEPLSAEVVAAAANASAAQASEAASGDEGDETDDEIEESLSSASAEPLEFIDESLADQDLKFEWYILKVQVNREDSIKDALLRRVKMDALDRYFKEVVVPTEDVAEFTKTGKRRVVKKKIYPGYILVNMAYNDDSWFAVRETPGIGDFTGAGGKPTPMDPKDVERILRSSKVIEDDVAAVKTAIPFKAADRVRVKEGYFQNFEGDVDAIDHANGRVTVMINIFGRSTPVELEHWQIEIV